MKNTITTNRLRLRTLVLEDSKYFFKYLPKIDTFLSLIAPKSEEESTQIVEQYLKQIQQKTAVYFAIEKIDSNEFIGIVGVNSLHKDWPERHCWIRKEDQNKGYAFEAISAFMKWANQFLDYTIMYSSFDKENKAIIRLNEKLGGLKGLDTPELVLQPSGKTLHILYYSYSKPTKVS